MRFMHGSAILPHRKAAADEQGMRFAPTQIGSAKPQPPPRLYAERVFEIPLAILAGKAKPPDTTSNPQARRPAMPNCNRTRRV